MAKRDADVVAAERALERLFRLSMSRKEHTRQAAAVGAVVTRAGYAVLRSLHEAGELTMSEVARECAMDPAATARQVNALEDDGLVERRSADRDARLSVVRLTVTGRTVHRRIVAVRTAYMQEVLRDWPSDDRKALGRLVDRLVDDLSAVPFRAPTKG
jgi:MarR family transcriptional regulator for hemolysin